MKGFDLSEFNTIFVMVFHRILDFKRSWISIRLSFFIHFFTNSDIEIIYINNLKSITYKVNNKAIVVGFQELQY